jgi:hypothetical protein
MNMEYGTELWEWLGQTSKKDKFTFYASIHVAAAILREEMSQDGKGASYTEEVGWVSHGKRTGHFKEKRPSKPWKGHHTFRSNYKNVPTWTMGTE